MSKKSTAAAPATRKPSVEAAPVAIESAFLTRTEAARYLRVSVRQLIRFVRAGALTEHSLNHVTKRYRREDLDAFAASRRIPAKEAA